jgi:hypothetical protein
MARGYRPDFYNADPVLHTIEILAWAAPRDAFSLREVLDQFNREFLQYKDAQHEASERLRKLQKSGMIVAVTQSVISAWRSALENKKALDPGISEKEIVAIENRMGEIVASKNLGRKPKLYRVTLGGARYVEIRGSDLRAIQKRKKSR